jgi:hypothetical protein
LLQLILRLLRLKSFEVQFYLFLPHFVILKLLQPVRLIYEIFELLKLREFGDAIVEEPPERLRAVHLMIVLLHDVLLLDHSRIMGVTVHSGAVLKALPRCSFDEEAVADTQDIIDEGGVLDSEVGDGALLHI